MMDNNIEDKIDIENILSSNSEDVVIEAILDHITPENKAAIRLELKQKSLAQLKQVYETYLEYT